MRSFPYFVLLIPILISSICFSQNPAEPTDAAPQIVSTRSLSMGGVYIATNQGIDALNGNPGGLALVTTAQVSKGARVRLYGKSDFKKEFYDFYTEHSSRFVPDFKLQHIGFVFPLSSPNNSSKLVAAASYRNYYDWQRKEVKKSEREDPENDSIIKYERIDISKGLMDVFSLGLGTTISERWSFGISLHLPARKGLESRYKTKHIHPEEIFTNNSKASWDVSAGGFFHLGSIFQLSDRLAVGVSCPLMHRFTIHHSKEEWRIPGTFDFGIAYRLQPDLLLAGEIQNRPWEDIRINDLPIADVESGNAYRLGLEYGRQIQLRCGFTLDRLPILDADDHGVDLKIFSVGLGFQKEDWIVDSGLSYKFATFQNNRWMDTGDYLIRDLLIYSTFRLVIQKF